MYTYIKVRVGVLFFTAVLHHKGAAKCNTTYSGHINSTQRAVNIHIFSAACIKIELACDQTRATCSSVRPTCNRDKCRDEKEKGMTQWGIVNSRPARADKY